MEEREREIEKIVNLERILIAFKGISDNAEIISG